jgi:ABC-type taurine transport system ATPase subunit
MNSAATIEQARALAQGLERRERIQGSGVDAARTALARKVGVTPATWRNLVRGRLKRLDAWMRDRLQALLVRELEAEIARLSHELQMARQGGLPLNSQHVSEAETYLAKVKAILNGKG